MAEAATGFMTRYAVPGLPVAIARAGRSGSFRDTCRRVRDHAQYPVAVDAPGHDLADVGQSALCQGLGGELVWQLVAQWEPARQRDDHGAHAWRLVLGGIDEHARFAIQYGKRSGPVGVDHGSQGRRLERLSYDSRARRHGRDRGACFSPAGRFFWWRLPATEPDADPVDDSNRKERRRRDQQGSFIVRRAEHNAGQPRRINDQPHDRQCNQRFKVHCSGFTPRHCLSPAELTMARRIANLAAAGNCRAVEISLLPTGAESGQRHGQTRTGPRAGFSIRHRHGPEGCDYAISIGIAAAVKPPA